jgi:hypothetical protein
VVQNEDEECESVLEDDVCLEYNHEGDLIQVSQEQVEAIAMGSLTSIETIGLCSQALLKVSVNIGYLNSTTTLQL